MSLRLKCAFAAACVITLLSMQCNAQAACSHRKLFSGEEDACLDHASSPPTSVIAAITAPQELQETAEQLRLEEGRTVASLLKGITIHLRDPYQGDMIVRGQFPMSGGDNTWFWIVTSIRNHPVALWVRCSTVTILRTRHHGYADIRTDWAAGSHHATEIFQHNGTRYRLFHENYEDTPPE